MARELLNFIRREKGIGKKQTKQTTRGVGGTPQAQLSQKKTTMKETALQTKRSKEKVLKILLLAFVLLIGIVG
jgi:hypothetical protein